MKWLIPAIVVCAAIALVGFLLTNGDDQEHVEVRSGDSIPSEINRGDDYGADTVRAYLTAALDCDEAALGRYGTPIEAIVALCQAKPDRVEAEAARDDLDGRGRALWKVSAADEALPSDLYVRVGQPQGNGWSVEAACRPIIRCLT
jgi:hypothetical protein